MHEKALRNVYKVYTSSFEDLLKRDNSVTIHHRNIQSLAIELFKVKQNLSNSMLNNIFPTRSISYNLRSQTDFIRSNASTSQYGLNSMRCFASKVWQMIPMEIKNSVSIESFKEKIRKWEPSSCNCKLCQPYINNLGYLSLKQVISRKRSLLYYVCLGWKYQHPLRSWLSTAELIF